MSFFARLAAMFQKPNRESMFMELGSTSALATSRMDKPPPLPPWDVTTICCRKDFNVPLTPAIKPPSINTNMRSASVVYSDTSLKLTDGDLTINIHDIMTPENADPGHENLTSYTTMLGGRHRLVCEIVVTIKDPCWTGSQMYLLINAKNITNNVDKTFTIGNATQVINQSMLPRFAPMSKKTETPRSVCNNSPGGGVKSWCFNGCGEPNNDIAHVIHMIPQDTQNSGRYIRMLSHAEGVNAVIRDIKGDRLELDPQYQVSHDLCEYPDTQYDISNIDTTGGSVFTTVETWNKYLSTHLKWELGSLSLMPMDATLTIGARGNIALDANETIELTVSVQCIAYKKPIEEALINK